MNQGGIDPAAFGAAFSKFIEQMTHDKPSAESEVRRRLADHFDADVSVLPIVREEFANHEHADLHAAVETYLAEPGREHDLCGVVSEYDHHGVQLAKLVARASGRGEYQFGPVAFVNLPVDCGRVTACVHTGLYLIRHGDERSALLVRGPHRFESNLGVEVMAATRESAEAALARLRTAMRARSVYRGRVISLNPQRDGSLVVKFHRLPSVGRGDIILPAGILERIERQAVRFAQLRDELRAAGRHLKRGLLLYGPPGTGKTLTAMYLAGQMPDRTVLLLTGRGLGTVEQSCAMARLLQPATVILEDVDLIAEERTHEGACNALLFELLNQMDGVGEDADILFVLTTNRADLLEPALAARPGRIDQAIEVPLPDDGCRSRLIDLYGRGLELRLRDRDSIVARTRGVSAAFLRELLRRTALLAADEGAGRVIDDRHVEAALHELIVDGGPLTRSLLGATLNVTNPPN